jgi:alcohol dehydrogenase class IV
MVRDGLIVHGDGRRDSVFIIICYTVIAFMRAPGQIGHIPERAWGGIMQAFDFIAPRNVLFGPGRIRELPANLVADGITRCLVVTGRSPQRLESVLALLRASTIQFSVFPIPTEPTLDLVRRGVKQAKEEQCDGVLAIGGGSALDAGKAIASLMRNEGDVLDFLEVIGHGKELSRPGAPVITVPTTAGTGAEVTRNAVLFDPDHRMKVSLRSKWMVPSVALVDPELTLSVPPAQTVASGMDALTQLIEPYVCNRTNPITDGLCLQGMGLVSRSLQRACANADDLEARSDMALASLLSGLALANAGLGVVHGFASPLGGMFDAPHGAICAALLPHGMRANISHLRRDGHPSPVARQILNRYRTVAARLTSRADAEPEDGVRAVAALNALLKVPSLATFGMRPEHAEEVAEKALKASSMKRNPVTLSKGELKETYLSAL